MPTGGARHGRRDNGLEAAEYAVVGDVDPRVGEHLLDVLAGSGIAAYLQPAADLHPITRTSTLPPRPTDRLYADRAHLQTARGYLSQLSADGDGPGDSGDSVVRTVGGDRPGAVLGRDGTGAPPAGPGTADIDAAWADIVAGFAVTVDPTAAPWPAAESVSRPTEAPGTDAGPQRPRTRRQDDDEDEEAEEPSLLDGLDTFGTFGPTPDDDEGYRPPPPPPLPRISSTAVAALVAVAAGILLLFWPSLLPLGRDMTMFLAFGSLLGGFLALVWRLRPGDEVDDDPDNGARV